MNGAQYKEHNQSTYYAHPKYPITIQSHISPSLHDISCQEKKTKKIEYLPLKKVVTTFNYELYGPSLNNQDG